MATVILAQAIRSCQDAVLVSKHLGRKALEGLALTAAHLGGTARIQKLSRSPKVGIAIVGAAIALACSLWLTMDGSSSLGDGTCPAAKALGKPLSPAEAAAAPSQLLVKAQAATPEDGSRIPLLKQCLDWAAPQGMPPMEQLRAQLQCHVLLLAPLSSDASEVEALLVRGRSALGVVRGTTQRCEDLASKLSTLSREKVAAKKPSEVLVALGGLAGFEGVARETAATLATLQEIFSKYGDAMQEDFDYADFGEDVTFMQRRFVGCSLKAAREARTLAQAIPAQHPAVARVQRCKPEMLLGFERLALSAAAAETDGHLLFAAGLVYSERITAPGTAPFFGENAGKSADLTQDDFEAVVLADMVHAERFLTRGLNAVADENQKDVSKQTLMRFAKHAKALAELKEYVGAEGRYRVAVDLAKKHGHKQLAASALAQLSYFLSLHNRHEEALEAAAEALAFSHDALAAYLQATLRLSLGELRTDEQVKEAAEQLRSVKGKLPAEHLESARASLESKLDAWQEVSDAGSFLACLKFGDAAFLLSCFLGRFTYNTNNN